MHITYIRTPGMAIMSGRVLKEIDGVPSVVDENSWRWQKPDGTILAACTCHVDDMAISGPQKWLDEHYNAFVTKFKKVSRQQLPFERCGATYERIPDGYRMVQSEFCGKVKPVKIAEGRKDDDKLNSEEVTSYRSILGALLWLTTSGIPHHRCRDQTSSTSQSSFAASPKQGRQGSWRLFLQVAPRARSTFGMFP